MIYKKTLSEILKEGDRQRLSRAWDATQAAADFAPLPPGEYLVEIENGELFKSHTHDTPGYKLTFRVLEGEHAGRKLWYDIWLTAAALPMAKRDLEKLDITSLEKLERPLRQGIRCRVRVVRRTDDDGKEWNRVTNFNVLKTAPPAADPFAPPATARAAAAEIDAREGGVQ